MKVALIYRQPSSGAFSIERLFKRIGRYLSGVEVVEFVMSGRSQLFADIYRIRKIDADIYHVTGDVNYIVPLLPRHKTVLTVHDIGHYLYGLKGWKRAIYKWLWFTLPLRLASAVTCVSRETASNLSKHFPIRKRIFIVENCLTTANSPSTKKFNFRLPRILQVGTKPYKNVPRLIRALENIPCTLILVGSIDKAIQEALDSAKIKSENHVGIGDAELAQLYQQCDIVAFVSTGEGFGLPILEAQAAAKPLITSNVPPLCDVAGSGACLVDPLDVESIREGVLKIIDDNSFRARLVESGLANVRQYLPEVIGAEYRAVYDAVCLASQDSR